MRVLLTGASHGLGASIAGKLKVRGDKVWDLPGSVILSGAVEISNFIAKLPAKPDVIINNYGINHLSWIGMTTIQDEDIIRANLLGPYWVVNYVKRYWGDSCRVVNVASQVYKVPQRCTTLYCASKAGLVHMTKVMARELAPAGWIVNAVSPGKIQDTEMSRLTDAQVLDLRGWDQSTADNYARALIPAGRYTTRAEIADVVIQTLGLPDYVNGAVIEAHGGI
jgi:NAD(P)-dependent dehydrogenase (short-subunit alcohol dehydrogenase family)